MSVVSSTQSSFPSAGPWAEGSLEELAAKGVVGTRNLRSSVDNLFATLSEGLEGDTAENIQELKQILGHIKDHYDKLETVVTKGLTRFSGTPVIGGQSVMEEMLSGAGGSEDTLTPLLQAYAWSHKGKEYADFFQRLSNSCLSFARRVPKRSHLLIGITPEFVRNHVAMLQNRFPSLQILTLQLSKTYSTLLVKIPTEADVVMFKIRLVVRGGTTGLVPLTASVAGPQHVFPEELNPYSKGSDESEERLFRCMTDYVQLSIQQLLSQNLPEAQLVMYLLYGFRTYANLFSSPCRLCKHILRDSLPPYAINFLEFSGGYMHEECRA